MALGNAYVFTVLSENTSAFEVRVEACVSRGLPLFNIVGLAEKAVRESRDRVRSALVNSGFSFPLQRVLVNLSPGDVPKSGCIFDLAIAMSILVASGQLKPKKNIADYFFASELGLTGELKPLAHVLNLVAYGHRTTKQCITSRETAVPECLQHHWCARGFASLREVWGYFSQKDAVCVTRTPVAIQSIDTSVNETSSVDWSAVEGEYEAKLALITALCGRHSLLLSGPPGVGKSLLVHVMRSVLPKMPIATMLDLARLYSCMGEVRYSWSPPFRKPHHNITAAALLGGGSPPVPGEISLAHGGVLFLDELPEFPARLLDQMRQPLIEKKIDIARAYKKVTFLANVQLVAAMNPCPCGYWGVDDRCTCGYLEVKKYQRRLSGPLLDRLDVGVTMGVSKNTSWECIQPWQSLLHNLDTSAKVRALVEKAQVVQLERQGMLNESLDYATLYKHFSNSHCVYADAPGGRRGFQKTVAVAMTLADIEQEELATRHVALAQRWSRHRNASKQSVINSGW